MTSPALSLADIDASWDEEPSGVRARPQRKPPLPVASMPTDDLARLYLLARFELEDRLDSGQRVTATVGGELVDLVRVADRFDAEGRFVARRGPGGAAEVRTMSGLVLAMLVTWLVVTDLGAVAERRRRR